MIREHVELQSLNTFGLKATARYFCEVDSETTLIAALDFAQAQSLPLLILGGGSNLLLREDFPGLVLAIALRGITSEAVSGDEVSVEAAGGENWHGFVSHCLQQGWHGLENLALIPGSVGAAPIQNIGAYGVEVGERIEQVTVFDIETRKRETLSAEQCQFGYRDSVFKRSMRHRKIVLSVRFRLTRVPQVNLSYAGLAEAVGTTDATPQQVFDAVCAIRRSKLPDPQVLGNAGSFFKNPLISTAHYERLRQQYPTIPGFASDDGHSFKVPAAWLIEKAGWKGRQEGGAAVYEKQALVIVNRDHATAQDVVTLALAILDSVRDTFGITLEPEVQWVPPFAET